MMKKLCALLVLLVGLQGCTSLGRVEAGAAAPADGQTLIVVGVTSANYRISVSPGSVDDGKFKRSLWLPAVVAGGPVDGYLVGKAAPGDTVAIDFVRWVPDANAVLQGLNFSACGPAQVMVFQVPKARVVYLGTMDYAMTDRRLQVQYSADLESARRYMTSHFPAIKDQVEFLPPRTMPTNQGCVSGTTIIPIYVRTK